MLPYILTIKHNQTGQKNYEDKLLLLGHFVRDHFKLFNPWQLSFLSNLHPDPILESDLINFVLDNITSKQGCCCIIFIRAVFSLSLSLLNELIHYSLLWNWH